jgi:apolipoprotein N-acyltransferase
VVAFQGFCGKLRRVNHGWVNPFLRSRYLVAIISGLLLTAAFPKLSVAGFAWIAPGLMIAAALGKSGGESFRIGFVAALTHYLTMLYWLLLIPYRWHGIPLGPAVGWLALSGFLALFPAVWVCLVAAVHSPGARTQNSNSEAGADREQANSSSVAPRPSPAEQSMPTSVRPRSLAALLQSSGEFEPLRGVLAKGWFRRTGWALWGAALWVALEMVLARIFGGFPWDLLGVSQFQMTPLIQFASATGVYGVSFLVVWVSLSLLSAALMLIRRPTARSVWVAETFVPVMVAAVLFNVGFRQLRHEPAATRTLKVTLIQPSIPQTLIWDVDNDPARFGDLLRLTETAFTNQTDLVVWPEAGIPGLLRYDTNTLAAVTGLARRHRVWMIVGCDDAEPRRAARKPDEADYFNSSFLVSPEGELAARYTKRNLVIFGEYLPLQDTLPFLKYFTPIQGGFTPGEQAVPFELENLGVQTSVLICFEDVFPHLARADVKPETDFLVNITNDGWFGDSAAPWQQAMTALFRTIENRVPLIRCSNNGLTCWIDREGRVRELFRDEHGTVYGPGFLTFELPLREPGVKHPLTFYGRHGDWFGWTCVAISGAVVLRRLWEWLKARRSTRHISVLQGH